MSRQTPADFRRWRTGAAPDRAPPKAFEATCYSPFVSMLLDPSGEVRVCCQAQSHSLGSVRRDRLVDIWRGEKMLQIREQMRGDVLPDACVHCDWEIAQGNFDQTFARLFDFAPDCTLDPDWPKAIWFMLGNECNLECVQCYGELSSSIRRNRDALPPLAPAYDERFFADIVQFLENVQQAVFLGGEPFLVRNNFVIWKALLDHQLKPNCLIVTNGTVFNERVEQALEAFPFSLSVSIDGTTKDTVESIRRNARFEKLMQNVERFLGYTRAQQTNFALTFCLMPQNQHEFLPFLQLAESLGCDASVNTVYDPATHSLAALPAAQLSAIVEQWAAHEATAERKLRRFLGLWQRERDRITTWARTRALCPDSHPNRRLTMFPDG